MFEQYYRDEFGFSSSNISWIGGLQLFLQFFLGAPSGIAFDFGYFRQLTIAGTIFYLVCVRTRELRAEASSGLFTLSVAKTYTQVILAQGALTLMSFAADQLRRVHGARSRTFVPSSRVDHEQVHASMGER